MRKEDVLQIIDKIIEKANEIKDLQKRIGASMIDENNDILVYEEKELLEYAEIAGECVKETSYVSSGGKHRISFVYKGCEFCSFVSKEELAQIREKVLPPTKVSEPNNKE